MTTNATNEQHIAKLEAAARSFAENLVKHVLKVDGFAEVQERQFLWTEFRSVYKQQLRVCRDFTTLTITAKPDGTLAGWLLEKRKATSSEQKLPDAGVEKAATAVAQVKGYQMTGIKRVTIDDKHSMAVATFQGPGKGELYDVYINHTTGELIGYLPTPGKVTPIVLTDPQAAMMEELAWKWLENELATKSSPELAAKTRSILKLSPLVATRDAADRITRVYRVWRFYTMCDVSVEETSYEVVSWYAEGLAADAPDRKISEAEALKAARPELRASVGVTGPKITFEKSGKDQKAIVNWWHVENNLNIEGDQTTVMINATTGTVFSVSRKWRKIPPELFAPPKITAQQSITAADAALKREPGGAPGQSLGECIIQVSPQPDLPGGVRDLHVWRVGYTEDRGMRFTDVAVDSQTGQVVRTTGW